MTSLASVQQRYGDAGAARAALRIGTERITVELIRAEAGLLTAAVA